MFFRLNYSDTILYCGYKKPHQIYSKRLNTDLVYCVDNGRDLHLHFLSVMYFLAVSRICVISVSRMTMSSVTWQAVASWCIKCSMLKAYQHTPWLASWFKFHVNKVKLVPHFIRAQGSKLK